jgi:tetratricopeptide (TPR) repeat protein
LLAVVVLLGGVAWGATEIHRTAIVEAAGGNTLLNSVRLPNPLDRQLWTADASLLPLADVESAMGRLEAAVQKSPDDAGARFHLAELHIARYRIRASEQMQEEALRQNPAAKINEAAVWAKTWPMVLHRAAHYLSRNGLTRQLHDLRTRRVVTDDLLPALKHAMAARNLCPLLPEVHEMIAELSVLATDPADDSVHVERAMRVRPGNPEDLRDCAMLDADAGRMERACRTWRRTLAMVSDDRFYILEEILKQAGMHMTPREIVAQIVPDSLPFLLRIARTIYTAPEQADARQAIADRMEQCLPQSTLPEDERCYYQGAAYALRGRYPQAIENYTRAVEMRSCSADAGWRGGAVPWRYELAMLLQGQGMLREAHEEALRCARQEPLNTAYRTLLEQINHNRVISEAAPE